MIEVEVISVLKAGKEFRTTNGRRRVICLLETNVGRFRCAVTLTGEINEDGQEMVDFILGIGIDENQFYLGDLSSIMVAQTAFPDIDFGDM